ncbi:hypothetical protein TNCV_2735301 [Trichonephila clavipes]|nr:hypothetical protein TNCV_2735301 [Trichonephila clavipes]
MPDEEVINNGRTRKGKERVRESLYPWRSWIKGLTCRAMFDVLMALQVLASAARFCPFSPSKAIERLVIEFLAWTGNSPDLNPIGNLWHRLKTPVRIRYP